MDDTQAIIKTYGDSIRSIHQSNRGVSVARNVGTSASHGDFIAYLDADDWWLPRRIEEMIRAVAGRRDTFIATDWWTEREGVRSLEPHFGSRSHPYFSLDAPGQFQRFLQQCWLGGSIIMVPRRVFDEGIWFDDRLRKGEDWDFFLRCCAHGFRIDLVPEPLIIVRWMRSGSLTSSRSLAHSRDTLRILHKHRRLVARARRVQALGSIQYHRMRAALAAGDLRGAIDKALRLARNWPYIRGVVMPELARRIWRPG